MKWLLLLLPLCGCRVPAGSINSVTLTCYGAMFGYDPGTKLPAMYLGLIHETAHSIPSNSPPITSSLSLEQHWLTTSVYEEFTTGNATIPTNSIARLRAMRVYQPVPPQRMPYRHYVAPKFEVGNPPMNALQLPPFPPR